ncbi:hypothetical protein [Kallotenue papyrolyticum]|uniref:hypothetical protein n=1 Tax=Kallotenue papyrolyticum TaxID=1325125 RepID=UPI000478629B|nr:hypothetical protein [Kallotenue papyrolyticum]
MLHELLPRPQPADGERPTFSLARLTGLLLVIVLVFGGFVYAYRTVVTGDPLWWSSSFAAQPRQLMVIDRGRPLTLAPGDPRFASLVSAFNATISEGYFFGDFGFSDHSWQQLERQGVLVEAVYAAPVRLHGGVAPTQRLRMLVGGDDLWRSRLLFRSHSDAWDRIPLQLHTTAPMRAALERIGIVVPPDS